MVALCISARRFRASAIVATTCAIHSMFAFAPLLLILQRLVLRLKPFSVVRTLLCTTSCLSKARSPYSSNSDAPSQACAPICRTLTRSGSCRRNVYVKNSIFDDGILGVKSMEAYCGKGAGVSSPLATD